MAIVSTKTWEYIVNVVVSEVDLVTRNRTLMLRLKECLSNTGSLQAVNAAGASISLTAPFEVVASSNGVTASAADNWSALSDIVFNSAGSAHSWLHLRLTDYFSAGNHLHLLIDCIPNIASSPVARVSWTRGATGYNNDGTITARPTHAAATPELVTRDGATVGGDSVVSDMMWGSDASNVPAIIHFRIASDGSAGSWFVASQGAIVAWHGWQDDEEGESTRVHPFHVWGLGFDSNAELISWAAMINTLSILRTIDNGGTERLSELSQSCTGSAETPIQTNNATSERMVTPSYIVNDSLNAVWSVFTDYWWGSNLDVTADGSPAGGPFTRRHVGELVIDWPSGVGMTVT